MRCLYIAVVLIATFIKSIGGVCFNNHVLEEQTVTGRKSFYCSLDVNDLTYNFGHDGKNSFSGAIKMYPGSRLRLIDCVECDCQEQLGLTCCGFGYREGEPTPPAGCSIIRDGCTPIMVKTDNKSLDCNTGSSILSTAWEFQGQTNLGFNLGAQVLSEGSMMPSARQPIPNWVAPSLGQSMSSWQASVIGANAVKSKFPALNRGMTNKQGKTQHASIGSKNLGMIGALSGLGGQTKGQAFARQAAMNWRSGGATASNNLAGQLLGSQSSQNWYKGDETNFGGFDSQSAMDVKGVPKSSANMNSKAFQSRLGADFQTLNSQAFGQQPASISSGHGVAGGIASQTVGPQYGGMGASLSNDALGNDLQFQLSRSRPDTSMYGIWGENSGVGQTNNGQLSSNFQKTAFGSFAGANKPTSGILGTAIKSLAERKLSSGSSRHSANGDLSTLFQRYINGELKGSSSEESAVQAEILSQLILADALNYGVDSESGEQDADGRFQHALSLIDSLLIGSHHSREVGVGDGSSSSSESSEEED